MIVTKSPTPHGTPALVASPVSELSTATQPIPKKSQQIKTDKPRPHVCSVCTRAFARLEHLKRHERSHTNEKPFQCAACGRCFARRDLVLRHQQKLHALLPNLGSRRSLATLTTKDENEHIIILQNNTSANAPLPKDDEPSFRTTLFSQSPQSRKRSNHGDVIPSPIPTNSSLNTPPNNNPQIKPTQQPLPHGDLPESHKHAIPAHVRKEGTRHASFSAASNISYTNLKDALNIQQNNPLAEGPPQVEFATPQLLALDSKGILSGLDLASLGVDWNIDSLDLSQTLSKKDKAYFDVAASHQFSNPNHPHHIKGTTPFEFGVAAPTDPIATPANISSLNSASEFNLNPNALFQNKRAKTSRASVSSHDSADWLQEIINTPYESNFPVASHHIGFTDLPVSETSPHGDEISLLFRSRQIDLVRQMHPVMPEHELLKMTQNGKHIEPSQISRKEPDIHAEFTIGPLKSTFFSEDLRTRIISMSNLTNKQFPPLEDLNAYMVLYEKEFNKYFPFIHLPSLKNPLVDNVENIPLLLSMAAIGALYSYHDSNTLLLFNLSKFHIQHFFEKEVTLDNLQFKKVPLMAHQCLVLHIFISMFLNEPNMISITSRQMKSMVGLIRSTNFDKPLEAFLIPPPNVNKATDLVVIQNNFDYFVMAQSRIRTIYCFYMLQVFRTALIGQAVPLQAAIIECGTHCCNENLWRCEDARTWYNELVLGENRGLVSVSNNESITALIGELETHYNFDTKLSNNNLLTLLMYVHEQIQGELVKGKSALNWRILTRPRLERLVRSWEAFFVRNGGCLVINDNNNYLLNANNELKLILPLYWFARIRVAVNITPLMEKILFKDWPGMNQQIEKLTDDLEGLREATTFANEVIGLWIHNIFIINDAKRTALRTPVFFVTCVFVSILIMTRYLDYIESQDELSSFDKAYWLQCNQTLQKIDRIVSPNHGTNTYSEFLRKQSNGAFDDVGLAHIQELGSAVRTLVEEPNALQLAIASAIKSSQLSVQLLFLGIRILADAPVWPLAMGFAEALKNRATHNSVKN